MPAAQVARGVLYCVLRDDATIVVELVDVTHLLCLQLYTYEYSLYSTIENRDTRDILVHDCSTIEQSDRVDNETVTLSEENTIMGK